MDIFRALILENIMMYVHAHFVCVCGGGGGGAHPTKIYV